MAPLIVRPSGVWNSRAPFNDYLQRQQVLSRAVAALQISTYFLREHISAEPNQDSLGKDYLRDLLKSRAPAANAWLNFRRSHGYDENKIAPQPTIKRLYGEAALSLFFVLEMAVIRLSSLFESYAQCWALNVLLTILENGQPLRPTEVELAETFLPFQVGRRAPILPGWWDILRSFPQLEVDLRNLPHLFTDPRSGKKVDKPISGTLNAYSVIEFWRAYRNLSVHTSKQITTRFHHRWSGFFAESMESLGHIERLEVGKPLPVHDDLYGAMAACHYRAALVMTETLIVLSNERRGHPEAPGPKTTDTFPAPPPSPLLLLPGDHPDSVRWLRDDSFRQFTAKRQGWRFM